MSKYKLLEFDSSWALGSYYSEYDTNHENVVGIVHDEDTYIVVMKTMNEHEEQSELLELKAKINHALAEAHKMLAEESDNCDTDFYKGKESMLELLEKLLR